MRVLVLQGDSSQLVEKMFKARGYTVEANISNTPPDLIVFTGGSDVDPSTYNEDNTDSYGTDIARDKIEVGIYEKCLEKGIPMVGICRGGQLLNVLNGGKMIQDLSPRISGVVKSIFHYTKPSDGTLASKVCYLNVDHHQGMIKNSKASQKNYITHRVNPLGNDFGVSTIDYGFYYKDTMSFCFQPHPEWGKDCANNFFLLLDSFYEEIGVKKPTIKAEATQTNLVDMIVQSSFADTYVAPTSFFATPSPIPTGTVATVDASADVDIPFYEDEYEDVPETNEVSWDNEEDEDV